MFIKLHTMVVFDQIILLTQSIDLHRLLKRRIVAFYTTRQLLLERETHAVTLQWPFNRMIFTCNTQPSSGSRLGDSILAWRSDWQFRTWGNVVDPGIGRGSMYDSRDHAWENILQILARIGTEFFRSPVGCLPALVFLFPAWMSLYISLSCYIWRRNW